METIVSFTHLYSGKVRDIYDAGEGRLLFVASDRMSAFDVVMGEAVPDKGRVLTAMTAFWLDQLADLAPNHLISLDVADYPADAVESVPGGEAELKGRSMLVRKAEMLQIECIVRGYITGSAWKEYKSSGTMHGASLPAGLQESSKLPEPVFTPSTRRRPATTRTSRSRPPATSSAPTWPTRLASSRWPPTSGARRWRSSAGSSSPIPSSSSG